MAVLLIEPHYLPSLEYFVTVLKAKEVILEVHQHFSKQTYKNRCYFVTNRGLQPLSVPVVYTNRTALKDVRIDYRQSWKREHWGAFYSAYGKAPFFEYFQDHFYQIWEKKPDFLLDMNVEFMTLCLKVLKHDSLLSFTESYEKTPKTGIVDQREKILPKKSFEERNLYLPFQYTQTFGNKFVPNASIVDLLMCEGTRAYDVLQQSGLFTW